MKNIGKVGRYFDTNFYFVQPYINWNYASIPTYWTVFQINDCPVYHQYVGKYYTIQTKSVTFCSAIQVHRVLTENLFRQSRMYLDFKIDLSQLPQVLHRAYIQRIIYSDQSVDVNKLITSSTELKYEFPFSITEQYVQVIQNEHLSGQQRECLIRIDPTTIFLDSVRVPSIKNTHNYTSSITTQFTNNRWQRALGTAHTYYTITMESSHLSKYTTNSVLVHSTSVWIRNIHKHTTTFSSTFSEINTNFSTETNTLFIESNTLT